jgi:hypothetical protein
MFLVGPLKNDAGNLKEKYQKDNWKGKRKDSLNKG